MSREKGILRQIVVYVGVAVAIIAAFFAGYYLQSYHMGQERLALLEKVQSLEEENAALETEVERLRGDLRMLESSNIELKTRLEAAKEQVDDALSKLREKEAELARLSEELELSEDEAEKLRQSLEKVREAVRVLEDDKELLIVLSSDVPGEREEAERFWNDTKEFVRKAFPNLLPTIDKILYYLGYYFDWLEARPETEDRDAICDWIFSYTIEADQYSQAVNQFRSEAYQLILSHVNTVLMEAEEIG